MSVLLLNQKGNYFYQPISLLRRYPNEMGYEDEFILAVSLK
jgi:hypothetical protein